jgi:hypothetical protein
MMALVRTHFLIDITAAVAFAAIIHRVGERLSYYTDVAGFGYPSSIRASFHFTPCPKCGTSCSKPEHYLRKEELAL